MYTIRKSIKSTYKTFGPYQDEKDVLVAFDNMCRYLYNGESAFLIHTDSAGVESTIDYAVADVTLGDDDPMYHMPQFWH
jgi:hypothetical protein